MSNFIASSLITSPPYSPRHPPGHKKLEQYAPSRRALPLRHLPKKHYYLIAYILFIHATSQQDGNKRTRETHTGLCRPPNLVLLISVANVHKPFSKCKSFRQKRNFSRQRNLISLFFSAYKQRLWGLWAVAQFVVFGRNFNFRVRSGEE